MEELSCHICDPRIKGLIIESHSIKTIWHGEEEEKASLGMCPSYPCRHMLLQQRKQKVSLSFIQSYRLLKIGIQSAASEELGSNILVEDRRTKVERLLAHIYLVQYVRMRYGPAKAESRSKDL